jgi:hypothetical protein
MNEWMNEWMKFSPLLSVGGVSVSHIIIDLLFTWINLENTIVKWGIRYEPRIHEIAWRYCEWHVAITGQDETGKFETAGFSEVAGLQVEILIR